MRRIPDNRAHFDAAHDCGGGKQLDRECNHQCGHETERFEWTVQLMNNRMLYYGRSSSIRRGYTARLHGGWAEAQSELATCFSQQHLRDYAVYLRRINCVPLRCETEGQHVELQASVRSVVSSENYQYADRAKRAAQQIGGIRRAKLRPNPK